MLAKTRGMGWQPEYKHERKLPRANSVCILLTSRRSHQISTSFAMRMSSQTLLGQGLERCQGGADFEMEGRALIGPSYQDDRSRPVVYLISMASGEASRHHWKADHVFLRRFSKFFTSLNKGKSTPGHTKRPETSWHFGYGFP